MAAHSPDCAFGSKAVDFQLPGVDGRIWTLAETRGPTGLLVMFLCNHCPYVKAIITRLVHDVAALKAYGLGAVAIMANDTTAYPEDSFENMKRFAGQYGLPFPYLIDESQAVARAYGAVCTPDFFGYNADLELQYRGRIDAGGLSGAPITKRELYSAMVEIAETGRGPQEQHASIGCSIKWR